MYRKRLLDITRAKTKPLLEQLAAEGQPSTMTTEFLNDWFNAVRGVYGFRNDAGVANFANRLNTIINRGLGKVEPKWGSALRTDYTVKNVQKNTRFILGTMFGSKIGLNLPRFALMNMPQTFLTLLPVVKHEAFMDGLMYVVRDMPAAIDEAVRAGGIPHPETGGFEAYEEFAGLIHTPVERVINFLRKGPAYIEAVNGAIAYHTGRIQVLKAGKGFKPHKAVRLFIPKNGEAIEETAHRYGLAMRKITQFSSEPTLRPLAYQYGMLGKVTGQFKTYLSSYAALMEDLWKEDPAGFVVAASGLWLLGGFGVVPFYEQVRHQLGRRGIELPEADSGVNWLLHTTGLTQSPVVGDLTKHFDITTAFAFVQPEMATTPGAVIGEVASVLGGPAIGTAAGLIAAGNRAVTHGDYSGAARTAASAISPVLLQGYDAVNELRGPLRSESGEPIMNRPGSMRALPAGAEYFAALRFMGLSQSPRMLRYYYLEEIISANRSRNYDRRNKLVAEARDLGIFFGKQTRAYVKGRVTKERKMERKGVW
jgi:hypothetical protein